MSSHHIEKITCPKCEKESDFVMWDSINTMLDPDMKQKVRTGEAFLWECPECNYKATVNYPALYHQMEDHVMIYFAPGDKTEAVGLMKGTFNGADGEQIRVEMKFGDDYKNRVVGSLDEFREKLMILDENLDDHVIELMKLFMTLDFQQDDPELQIAEFLLDKSENGNKAFTVRLSDGSWGQTEFDQDMYDSIAEDFKNIIENDKEVVIDFGWALQAVKNREQKA